MADNTKIEWADATVNAINGCSVTSPGCSHCYAMKLAGTRIRNHPTRQGLTIDSKAGPVWNGEVRLHEPALLQPLTWKKPRRIFWNAHGDTFHENVPDEWIDRIFAVAALTPQHTHMILTKRSARMREYVKTREGMGNAEICRAINAIPYGIGNRKGALEIPLPNMWLGVSVEDQTRADERIPDLLATPAAVRFISAEPLLGPVDLACIKHPDVAGASIEVLKGFEWSPPDRQFQISVPMPPRNWTAGIGLSRINWVIAGGESGHGARPMHPDWARSLRDQCAAAGVPFHFKQWGEWRDQGGHVPIPRRNHQSHICYLDKDSGKCKPNPNRFSDETMIRLGKGKSGRLLDGVEHNGMPGEAK